MRPRGLGRGLGALIPAAAPGRFTDGPSREFGMPGTTADDHAADGEPERDVAAAPGQRPVPDPGRAGPTPDRVDDAASPSASSDVDAHAARPTGAPGPSSGTTAPPERPTPVVLPSAMPVRWSVATAPARSSPVAGLSMSGQLAAVLASRLPDPSSDTVSAVDRWLWRDGEPQLPGGPAAERADVPRGTSPLELATPGEEPTSAHLGLVQDTPAAHGAGPAGSETLDGRAAAGAAAGADGVPASGAVYAELDAASIGPNPRQPRQVFDQDSLEELAASIREVGLLQPVVVRAVGDHYELVMGERRLRAAQLAGMQRIPAIVKAAGDDVLLRDALLENIQRVQLNPLEEAAAYGQLLEDFGCTQEELATRLGKSRPQVTNTLRLLRLSPPVQRRVAAGVLSAGHAKALLGLADPADQERLAGRAVAEGLSVRSLEELVNLGTPAGAPRGRHSRSPVQTAGFGSTVVGRLTDRLDTRVSVAGSRERGRLIIEFAGERDLARLADLIDPPLPAGATEA